LFLSLAFAAAGSQHAQAAWWFGSLAALWVCAVLMNGPSRTPLTSLTVAITFFAAWFVATDLWANPSYSVGALYHAALMLGGFLFGRAAGQQRLAFSFRVALVFALTVALWALWRKVAETDPRAHSVFVTPATLSSVLNLLLVPTLILVACGERRYAMVGAVFILSAAFTAAQSRGGWVALATALVFAFFLLRRAGVKLERRATLVALMAFIAGALAAWLLNLGGGGEQTRIVSDAAPSLQERLDLYALALKGLENSSWLFGAGYHAFFYLLSSAGVMPLYAGRSTYFVHNDYLQMLFELGWPALGALLLLVALPLRAAWRSAPRMTNRDDVVALAALAAAVCSMATHALVDFPFYIPLCALVYGAALGFIDAMGLASGQTRAWTIPWTPRLRGVVLAALATIVAWILTMPVAAEAAGEYGLHQWRAARNQSAAYWLETARRLDRRDWRYHWYAGEFWFAQAAETGSSEAAALADAAFASASAANSREARSLYSRIVLHSRLRKLLATPADAETMRAWANRAAELAPVDPKVRAERERVLKQFGAPK
jgi:O-antigen ligase